MNLWATAFAELAVCGAVHGAPTSWQPAAGHTQVALWPRAVPDSQPVPGPETVTVSTELLAGRPMTSVRNVTQPTMTVFAPSWNNSGAAVVVIPGGGFQILAIDLEGTEVCDWLTSRGIICVLLKLRTIGIIEN